MFQLSVLVVGATGNTGKHVVRQLLDEGHQVNVIVRSKQRMIDVLPPSSMNDSSPSNSPPDSLANANSTTNKFSRNAVGNPNLVVNEGSILEFADDEIAHHVRNADAVVCCLGHNLSFNGIFGEPRRLVRDTTRRLTRAMIDSPISTSSANTSKKKRFILMSSDGVVNPAGTDIPRSWFERLLFGLIRFLLPPHVDNEEAADVVYSLGKTDSDCSIEWTVVRPCTLIEGDVSRFKLLENPGPSALFGPGIATRANVARAMVDLLTIPQLWEEWKFQFPVVHDDSILSSSSAASKTTTALKTKIF